MSNQVAKIAGRGGIKMTREKRDASSVPPVSIKIKTQRQVAKVVGLVTFTMKTAKAPPAKDVEQRHIKIKMPRTVARIVPLDSIKIKT
jgi:hypothetical protein